jgi:NAD(P)-dependent dehydrogenase (short-subunit alcohol dehydrogenase family)
MTFSNKVAIVAGGSSGIGLATALRLAEDGARVAICSHDATTLEPAQAQIRVHGEALAVLADVASADARAPARTLLRFRDRQHPLAGRDAQPPDRDAPAQRLRRDRGRHGADPDANLALPGRDDRVLPVLMTEVARLERGDVYRHVMSGGGGFGDPLVRVLQEVIEEKISPAHAQQAYGVVITIGSSDPRSMPPRTRPARSALRAAAGS